MFMTTCNTTTSCNRGPGDSRTICPLLNCLGEEERAQTDLGQAAGPPGPLEPGNQELLPLALPRACIIGLGLGSPQGKAFFSLATNKVSNHLDCDSDMYCFIVHSSSQNIPHFHCPFPSCFSYPELRHPDLTQTSRPHWKEGWRVSEYPKHVQQVCNQLGSFIH